jgi:hypothetical protein
MEEELTPYPIFRAKVMKLFREANKEIEKKMFILR